MTRISSVGPDFTDPENPMVVLRLNEETAETLRSFLQHKDVGKHETLATEVYRPLLGTQCRIRDFFNNLAQDARQSAEKAEYWEHRAEQAAPPE